MLTELLKKPTQRHLSALDNNEQHVYFSFPKDNRAAFISVSVGRSNKKETKSNLIRGANHDSFIKCKNTFTSTVLLIRTVAGLVIDLKLYTSKQQIHWSGFGV